MSPLDKVLNTLNFAKVAGKEEKGWKKAKPRHGQKEEGPPAAGGKKSAIRFSMMMKSEGKDVDEEDVQEALSELKHMSQQCRSFGAPSELSSLKFKEESLLRSLKPSVAPPPGVSISPEELEEKERAEAVARAAWHQQRLKQLQGSVGLEEGPCSVSASAASSNLAGKENAEVQIKTRIGCQRSLRLPQYLLDGSAHGHADVPQGHCIRSSTGPRRAGGSSKKRLNDSDSQADTDDESTGTGHTGVFGSSPDTHFKGSMATDNSTSQAPAAHSTSVLAAASLAATSLSRHTLPRLGHSAFSGLGNLAKDDTMAAPAEVPLHTKSQGTLPPLATKPGPEAPHPLSNQSSLLSSLTPASSMRSPLPALSSSTSTSGPALRPGHPQQRPSSLSQPQLDLHGLFAEDSTADAAMSAPNAVEGSLSSTFDVVNRLPHAGSPPGHKQGHNSDPSASEDRGGGEGRGVDEDDLHATPTAGRSSFQQDLLGAPFTAEGKATTSEAHQGAAQHSTAHQGLEGVEDLVATLAHPVEPQRASMGSLSHADSDSSAAAALASPQKGPARKFKPKISFQRQQSSNVPNSHFLPSMDSSSAMHRFKGSLFAGNKQDVGRMDIDTYIRKLEAEGKGKPHMARLPSFKRSKSMGRSLSIKRDKGDAAASIPAAYGSTGNVVSPDAQGGIAGLLQQFAEADSELQRLREHSRSTRWLNKGQPNWP